MAALLALGACGGQQEPELTPVASTPSIAAPGPWIGVRYEVEGQYVWGADITMQTPTGSSQVSAKLPLQTKGGDIGMRQTFDEGAFVYLSAQSHEERGSITCRIVRVDNGRVISENTSSGAFAIATCKGRAE
ncbi:MAG TPA: hypothetical protein VFL73_01915 [Solirubrobacteraceae bacterium]|nr:hypothetical protein [Solirubrobacteraceae bacterium]